jgi:hypothetical protein
VVFAVAAAVTMVLVVGSVVEIHAQSSGYRSATDSGYGALASKVVDDSNRTGAQLAAVMDSAPGLTNQALPRTARAVLQQGLDAAVSGTAQEATQAASLVPPYPSDDVANQLTQVMEARATGASDLRTSIDRLLGMTPLPIAGAPTAAPAPSAAPLTSPAQAATSMGQAGLVFQQADVDYRDLVTHIRSQRLPIRLPRSVWVPEPIVKASLGSPRLAAAAGVLGSSAYLAPFHRLAITAVGIAPPAVTTGGPGVLGADCPRVQSTVPGPTPTILPPTSSLTAEVTVTNCGTVPESGVKVTQTLTLSDPPGTTPPPPKDRGSTSRASISLRSGSSQALTLPALRVASGHTYTLRLAVAVPAGQVNRAGSTQTFLIRISD